VKSDRGLRHRADLSGFLAGQQALHYGGSELPAEPSKPARRFPYLEEVDGEIWNWSITSGGVADSSYRHLGAGPPRSAPATVDLLPKVKLEMFVADSPAEEILGTLSAAASSGKIGNGKIRLRHRGGCSYP